MQTTTTQTGDHHTLKSPKQPHLWEALLPIVSLLVLLFFNIRSFGDEAVAGPNQIALMLASALAGLVAIRYKVSWQSIQEKMVSVIGDAMPSILILLLIGALAGTWMISGVVPMLVYYGLDILHPKFFLVIAVIICSLVSLAIGSSWSTIATIGVALLGIGTAMGFHPGLVAGAIISGAYFGDKMSPMSDTTNLAPAMAGTDLFTHIRYMMYTTIPAILLTLIIFFVLGFTVNQASDMNQVDAMLLSIKDIFHINLFLLLVPLALIVMILKKVPPIPALLGGVVLGVVFTVIFQQDLLHRLADPTDGSAGMAYFQIIMRSVFGDFSIPSANEQVNNLLSTGGMRGMLDTIWLILTAMIFSGVMESAGLLERIAHTIHAFANSTGSLVASTVATSIFVNLTASEQYIAIVLPGRMYRDLYAKRGLKPELLSRTLEDGGTVTSVLIPWNTCGAVQATVLGVPTLHYAPYVFFSLLSPLVTIVYAYLGIAIRKIKPEKERT